MTPGKRGRPPVTPEQRVATSMERLKKYTQFPPYPSTDPRYREECWPYAGDKLRLGDNSMVSMVRFVYTMETGVILPAGHKAINTCHEVPRCANPYHIVAVQYIPQNFVGHEAGPIGPQPLASDDDLLDDNAWLRLDWRERVKKIELHNLCYKDDIRDPNLHVSDSERRYG